MNYHNYNEFIKELYSLSDEKYRNFHSKIIKDNKNLIGIRTPILKNIAKEISRGDYNNFIKNMKHNTYEEKIIHGLIIGYIKTDFDTVITYLDEFIKYIDNWAINDIVAANLKIFNKNQNKGFKVIEKYLKMGDFYTRFGLVLLLDYYINDSYIDKVLDIAFNMKDDKYYVNMANSWLISICYIKYPDKTLKYLKNSKLDKFTHNKAISKICDSYKVSKKEKIEIKKLRKDG